MTNPTTKTTTIKDLIGNGDGMANDVIFTEGQFEWFKSSEDGYIYTRNIVTGRNTRYNAEGQNGKRIGDVEYITKFTEAMARFKDTYEAEDAHEEPAPAEEASKADPAPKAKKTKKRAKKDVAFRTTIDGTEITLTDKQVDFMHEMVNTLVWDGFDHPTFIDMLVDEIGGQFKNKPMTVGAMISTICEKGLGTRTKTKVDGRKVTAFTLTEKGQQVAEIMGL